MDGTQTNREGRVEVVTICEARGRKQSREKEGWSGVDYRLGFRGSAGRGRGYGNILSMLWLSQGN